jgi:osmotically inducible protein OsmC
MNSIKRNASVRWKSGPASGCQNIQLEDTARLVKGMLQFSAGEDSEAAPAALFAAAHASSFSMALANRLEQLKMDSGTFLTTAVVTLRDRASGWTVSNVHLSVLAKLPKISQCEFIDATIRAKTTCTACRLVRANISMEAKLESNLPAMRN